jgi:hypothetical protein
MYDLTSAGAFIAPILRRAAQGAQRQGRLGITGKAETFLPPFVAVRIFPKEPFLSLFFTFRRGAIA